VFWPASGIAAGISIALGRRAVPALVVGVVAGTVASGLMSHDRSLVTFIFNSFWNAGEAVFVAWLLERWFGTPFTFSDLGRVAGFLAAAALATAAAAVAGAATMTLLHGETTAPYWDAWRSWFLSGWVGLVVVAPLVIELAEAWREPPSHNRWIEGVGVLGLTAVACSYTMTQATGSWLSFAPSAFVLPLLLWLTARCQPAFGIAGAFVVSTEIILATTFGMGRFGDAAVPITQRAAGARVAMMMVTIFTLVLAVMFARQKEAEESLRDSKEQLAKERTMLARLHEVGARLWLKRDLRQALDDILAGAIELLGADMGAIRILDTTQGVLKIAAHRGFKQEFLDFFREVSAVDDSACGRVLRTGERMVIEDVEADTLYTPFRFVAYAAGYRAVQSTPIIGREGALLGTLATHFRSVHRPDKQDLRLLDLYVRQAADIIERHKAEDSLRISEERLRLAQSKTGVGVWDWNLRTGAVACTPELEAIFGLEPGTMTCYADFRDRVHPDDLEAIEANRKAALQNHNKFRNEFRIIRSDGEVRWLLSSGGAFYDEATGEPVRVLGNNVDITERKELEDHKNTLISELDHRVKNVLATVLTVASRTQETSSSMGEFVAAFEGRIKSMATTHELLSSRHWQGIPLAELVRHELAPYTTANNTRIDGPGVVLTAEAGQTLAMVFHELATNAAKFGAISVGSGRLSVHWNVWNVAQNGGSQSRLCIRWEESDGPNVVPPTRSGFGTSIVRELIPYELGGSVEPEYPSAGFRCKVEIPGHWITTGISPARRLAADHGHPHGWRRRVGASHPSD
jgi:PAS domain S-box-containing protein